MIHTDGTPTIANAPIPSEPGSVGNDDDRHTVEARRPGSLPDALLMVSDVIDAISQRIAALEDRSDDLETLEGRVTDLEDATDPFGRDDLGTRIDALEDAPVAADDIDGLDEAIADAIRYGSAETYLADVVADQVADATASLVDRVDRHLAD